MQVVKLKDIQLVDSTIDESTYDEYDSAHSYSVDDIVYVSFEDDGTTERTPHEIYQSLTDTNQGNYPPDNPAEWSLVGATNRWKMFDGFVNTQTESSSSFTVVIDTSECNAVGLFNIVAKTVTFTTIADLIQDENGDYYTDENGDFYGTAIKTETVDLDDSPVFDYYDYFFAPFYYKSAVYWEVPYYSNTLTMIAFEPYLDEAKCGVCVTGYAQRIGTSKWGVQAGITDYSKKDTDDLGRTYLSQGLYAKNNEVTLNVLNSYLDITHKILSDVRGTPAIFNANEEGTSFDSLLIYGFYENFDIIIPGPTLSKCSLEVKGLT